MRMSRHDHIHRLPENFTHIDGPIFEHAAESLEQVRASLARNECLDRDVVCHVISMGNGKAKLAISDRLEFLKGAARLATLVGRSPHRRREILSHIADKLREPASDGYVFVFVTAGNEAEMFQVTKAPRITPVEELVDNFQRLLESLDESIRDAFDAGLKRSEKPGKIVMVVDAVPHDGEPQGTTRVLTMTPDEIRPWVEGEGADPYAVAGHHAFKAALTVPRVEGKLRTVLMLDYGMYALDLDVFTPRGDA